MLLVVIHPLRSQAAFLAINQPPTRWECFFVSLSMQSGREVAHPVPTMAVSHPSVGMSPSPSHDSFTAKPSSHRACACHPAPLLQACNSQPLGCHTPAQSWSSLPCHKSTPYKVRVVFCKSVYAVRVSGGPPGPNHDCFTAKRRHVTQSQPQLFHSHETMLCDIVM